MAPRPALLLPLSLTAGCFAPALRPVEMVDLGHVSLTAGAIFPDANANGNDFEFSAVGAVGVAPHLQLELSGAIDSGDASQGGLPFDWSLGAGLRGGIPLSPEGRIEVAALYEQLDASLTRTGFCSSGSTSVTRGSRETLEVGPVFENHDRTFAFGVWLDPSLGEMQETSTGSLAGPGLPLDIGLRLGIQARPWAPDLQWLSLVFGASFAFPVHDFNSLVTSTSGFEDSSQTWTDIALGANVTF